MSESLHCYEYVNRPYDAVREALAHDASGTFERATTTATGRASSLVASLKVSIAGLEIGKDVVVRVTKIDRHASIPGKLASEATRIELEWHADSNRALFPSMHAELLVYPLGSGETQLDLTGTYDPPGGVFGTVADKLVGHRIAQASVHRFLQEVAARLSADLAP